MTHLTLFFALVAVMSDQIFAQTPTTAPNFNAYATVGKSCLEHSFVALQKFRSDLDCSLV